MDPFATHIPVLAAAVAGTTGNMLEVGTGPYSNLLMRALAHLQGAFPRHRYMLTLEHDARWLEGVQNDTIQVSDWNALPPAVTSVDWGCVFVDCAPAEARVPVIRQLAPRIKGVLVIHDTEPSADHVYRYPDIYPLFKYRTHWGGKYPMTSVLTNDPALSGIIKHLCP